MSEQEIHVPDDLSELDDERPIVALVITPVAAAAPLAAACALAKVDADVVPSEVGAIAVLRDPGTGRAGAAAVSALLRQVPVVLLERRESQMSASQWVGGEHTRDLPPGLVLSDAPEVLEDLLLDGRAPATVQGVVTSVGMSKLKAMRTLAAHRPRR
ncbi:MAG TPA: hypothetical protein VGC04_12325 [Cellulomonas sp.]